VLVAELLRRRVVAQPLGDQMAATYYWICNECARAEGSLPTAPATSALSTPYQEERFRKHTLGSPTAPTNSIFTNQDRKLYDEVVGCTLQGGAVQFDEQGRKSVFRAINQVDWGHARLKWADHCKRVLGCSP